MAENGKYFVVKNRNDASITYFEYNKVKGYDVTPRNVKIKDAIDVERMIIINPSMIQKLAFKKVNSKFQRIVKLLMFVLSEDNNDESGESYKEALNEITKLRLEVFVKYKNNLKQEDFEMFNKKLDILEQELKTRLYYLKDIYNYDHNYDKEGKSR